MRHGILARILFLAAAASCFAQTTFKFDFGPGPLKSGYTRVLHNTTFSAAQGYGWDFNLPKVTCADRGGADSLTRDLCYRAGMVYFSVVVPEGNYTVSLTFGDAAAATATTVKVESRRLFLEKVTTAPGEFVTKTFTVSKRVTAISGMATSVGVTTRETLGLNWDGKLTFEFNNTRPSLAAMEIVPAANPVQIFLAGNSTVCDWATETEAAWGQMIPRFFKPGAVVTSIAESGLTAGSFISQRRLDKINSLMKAGDYLFAEFAHNDQSGNVSAATYRANMGQFIRAARLKGATPVFVSPTTRRQFDTAGNVVNNTFVTTGNVDLLALMKQVARDSGIKLIDLNAMSAAMVQSLGPTGSTKAYWLNGTTQDNTHFNNFGAYELAKCIAKGIKDSIPGLAAHLTDDFTGFNPSQPDTGWTLPQSADTSVWHSAPTSLSGRGVLHNFLGTLSVETTAASVSYALVEVGKGGGVADFAVYAVSGKRLAHLRKPVADGSGAFHWKALEKLAAGEYTLRMTLDGREHGSVRFSRQ